MILPDFKAFPKNGRLLGIDWGKRRVGIAVSDETRQFVFARPVMIALDNQKDFAKKIADFAKEEKVVGIVLGLPVRSDGSESDTTLQVRNFANDVSEFTDLPICFIDETLTSISAQEQMGKVRVRQIKESLDSESAKLILENAISVLQRL